MTEHPMFKGRQWPELRPADLLTEEQRQRPTRTLPDLRTMLAWKGDDDVGNFDVSGEWLEAHSLPADADIGFCRVNGNCMEPTLLDGQRIAFWREEKDHEALRRGGVFVFTRGGRVFVKRLRIIRDNLHIIKDAWPAASEVMCKTNLMFYCILGRVFWAGADEEIGRTVADLSAPAPVKRICA